MSSMQLHETIIFDRIFVRSRGAGYVLDFSDHKFKEFFNSYNINIDNPKYRRNGVSKLKRLGEFCKLESDPIVGKVLDSLVKYAEEINCIENNELDKAKCIINRLIGINNANKKSSSGNSEEDFLKLEFLELDLSKLDIDIQLSAVVFQRINEIKICLKSEASLSVIFLCGSTLEGILLDVATKNNIIFNTAKAAPKDKEAKVLPIHFWALNSLIDVSHELGFINLDIKKFSHVLKDFRNYIHPRQQASYKFNPDRHTAIICWQVLRATIANLTNRR